MLHSSASGAAPKADARAGVPAEHPPFTTGGLAAYANVRSYWEFWAEHRLQGYAMFATR